MKRPYDFIYFIGDSYTYAIGQTDDQLGEINVNNRFSQLVADHYKLEHVNQAQAGQSNQWIARTLQDDMIAYNIEDKNTLVVVSYTDTGRHEMWDNKLGQPDTCNPSQSWYKDWIIDGHNLNFSNKVSQYHINASRFLLRYLKFDFVELYTTVLGTSGSTTPITATEVIDLSIIEIGAENGLYLQVGGFLGHLNITGHKLVTDVLIKKINELYG